MSTNDANAVATLVNLFQRYDPLSNLNDTNLSQLAKGASSFKLSKRQRLLAADEHRWLVYLVSGSVQGKDANAEVFNIRPSKQGQMALFDAQPRPIEVTVTEDAQFLRVDRKQFSVLMNEQISSSTLVDEIELEDDSGFFDTLVQCYQSGALKLPLRDNVISTVVPLLADGNTGTDNVLVDVMRSEPALALVVANIAGTSGQFKAGELAHLRQLVDQVDRSQLAADLSQWGRDNPFPESGTPMYQRIVTAYDYLRRVGTFSRAIAKELGTVDADLAEYAGMCSKVGLISSWLMMVAEDDQQLGEESSVMLDQMAPLVTEMLLGQMRVDSQVTACVEAANTDGERAAGEINVSDVVRVAVTYLPMDIHGAPVSLVEDEALMELFNQSGIGLRELDIIMEKCNLDAGSSLRMAG